MNVAHLAVIMAIADGGEFGLSKVRDLDLAAKTSASRHVDQSGDICFTLTDSESVLLRKEAPNCKGAMIATKPGNVLAVGPHSFSTFAMFFRILRLIWPMLTDVVGYCECSRGKDLVTG